jgi:hypothetical protein
MSFSVPLIIKTLQKYPELAKRVDMVISISGFAHRDDFIFPKNIYWSLRTMAAVFSRPFAASIAKNVILTKPVIKTTYNLVSGRHSKMKDAIDKAELDRRIDFEIGLWQMNDVRTRMKTMTMMFKMDVCKEKIDLPVYHVTATEDRYFDNEVVKQHFHVIFKDVHMVSTDMPSHAPSIMATAKEAKAYVPLKLRKILG